jgi:hypothetical protein
MGATMDYYEGVVTNYLRADRAVFVNTECCIQLNPADNPDTSGPHWYCDAVAVDFRAKGIFLCEISYGKQLSALTKRMKQRHENWASLCQALARESFIPSDWPVRPWFFVPEAVLELLLRRLGQIGAGQSLGYCPRITPLEMVQPWQYRSWNRTGEKTKPPIIPADMRT